MATIFGQGPYNRAEDRLDPIHDAASWVDDAGSAAPTDALAAIRLAYPASYGSGAFVAGLACGPGLASAILAVAEPASGRPTLLGAATLAPPTPYAPAALVPFVPGVAGWVVFGRGAARPYAGRFGAAAQARLLPRCVRTFAAPPIPSLAKEGAAAGLSGFVTLAGSGDVAVSAQTLTVQGRPTRCIVLALADGQGRNTFALYAGPCAARPESGTCPRPPVRSLGGVVPDAAGNIDLDLRNLEVAWAGRGGIRVRLPVGMAALCGEGLPGPASPYADAAYTSGCSSDGGSYAESSLTAWVPEVER